MRLSDVHMHHFRSTHLRGAELARDFSPLREYLISQHVEELQENAEVEVDLVICAQLSVCSQPDHVLDAVDSGGLSPTQNRPAVLGLVGADPRRARDGSIQRSGICGVRLMVGGKNPSELATLPSVSHPDWPTLMAVLAQRSMHFTTMCFNKETAISILSLVPEDIPVGFDHLGLTWDETDPDETGFVALLDAAKARGNVYFKGPGYRTTIAPDRIAPMIARIIKVCGPQSVLLGATDAPHVWTSPQDGKPLRQTFPHQRTVLGYIRNVADHVKDKLSAEGVSISLEQLMSTNALETYKAHL